jgi:hypothetical protein
VSEIDRPLEANLLQHTAAVDCSIGHGTTEGLTEAEAEKELASTGAVTECGGMPDLALYRRLRYLTSSPRYVHLNSYSILQPFYTLLQLALSMETWHLHRSPVVLAVPRYHETRRCCSVVHTVSSANLQYTM